MTSPKKQTSEPVGPKWWTARECQVYLGGISRQKWGRLRAEYPIPTETDDKGIDRFESDFVIDLGERLGLPATDDPSTIAMQVLREAIESLGEHQQKMVNSLGGYIDRLHEVTTTVIKILHEENDSIRKLRAEEQAAHLNSILATQEALDMSAERTATIKSVEASEERKQLGLSFVITEVWPRISQQIKTSGNSAKVIELVKTLDESQIAALKSLIPEEHAKALDELRGASNG